MSSLIRFDESHYFICTGGLKPARFKAKPAMTHRGDGNYYLNFQSRTCKGMDFSCRYIALYGAILGALIAALCATGAGALLVGALIGAAVFAAGSTALSVCGTMVAIMRNWERNTWTWGTNVEKYAGVANRKPPHLTCNVIFSNTISFAPNVTSEFHALALFAGNIIFTGLEGFMWIYGVKGLGVLLKSPTQFLINFGANYLKSWTKKGIAVRVGFGLWGGFDAYSKSSNQMTFGQAFTSGEVWMGAAGGFGFIESAILHAAQGDPASIMFLLTMGSGAKPSDQKKFLNIARQFRQQLRTLKNGVGAKESPITVDFLKDSGIFNSKGKVGYGKTDLSKIAIAERYKNGGMNGEGNVAVYEWIDPKTGQLKTKAFATNPSVTRRHAERIGWEWLESEGIPNENVTRIYSELHPCELPSGGYGEGGCQKVLNEKFPNAEKTHSYDYPGDTAETRPAREQGKADLKEGYYEWEKEHHSSTENNPYYYSSGEDEDNTQE